MIAPTDRTTSAFRRIVVWPNPAALAHALDWTRHLHRPMHEVASAEQLGQVIGPDDLLVIGHEQRHRLGSLFADETGPAILDCPDECRPLSRVMILHEEGPFSGHFLQAAREIGMALRGNPVVLTLAASERAACRQERTIRDAVFAAGLAAEFDFLAGPNPGAGIARVARWRHCQVVLWQRPAHLSWWERWWHDPTEWLAELAEAVAVLEIPEQIPSGFFPRPAAMVASYRE